MDDLDNPALWGLIWLGLAASLAIVEIVAIGGFFLIPFAVGALVAATVSFIGAPVPVGFIVFFAASLAAFYLLRPLARRLDLNTPNPIGVGANRLIGDIGTVTADIPIGVDRAGEVKIGGESWNAEGRDGMGIPAGTAVRIIEVKGTRVIVEPAATSQL